jgi:hypothetical protein
MRRGHVVTQREREREREVNDRKRREKGREEGTGKEDKTTLTDFRIVGIEMKSLGWSWGLVGGVHGEEEVDVDGVEDDPIFEPKTEDAEPKMEQVEPAGETKVEADSATAAKTEASPAKADAASTEQDEKSETVKEEPIESHETVEEKRGEKRKAKTPEAGKVYSMQCATQLIL